MALSLNLFSQIPSSSLYFTSKLPGIFTRISASPSRVFSPTVRSIALNTHDLKDQTPIITRRSGNYQPPNWEFDYIQSLKNEYAGEKYISKCNALKEQVKMMLDEEVDMLSQLELISDLERLGVSYHFHDKIQSILSRIHKDDDFWNMSNEGDLYATSLGFRLMRQHGFHVSQEIFNCFKDENGDFKPHLCTDIKGMLQLFEASFLLTEHENTLELAREFTAEHLRRRVDIEKKIDQQLAELVQHALELPLHWRMQRAEARWFIDIYEKEADSNPILLEFAKLNFNIVQATHQEDLKYALRWWRSTCLAEKLTFARDRLVENFFWTIGETFEPQHGYCRRISTKVNALLTVVDDIYDVYGTLDELELFTTAIERWDIEVIDQLPDYMKICYFAVYNNINELAYDVMKEQGIHIISHLRKPWVDICKAYLQEAKWYYSGYKPTLQEFLDNAWISVAAPAMIVHTFFCVTNPITKEALECLDRYPNIIRYSTTNVRFADDLGTSSDELKRGDVPKSIQCYMYETGASEEEAREHVKLLTGEMWKRINTERVADSLFSPTFIGIAVNLCRMAQDLYQHGDDGHANSNPKTKAEIRSLLFDPIHLS